MRFLFLLLTALCLSALSFGASAAAHVGLSAQVSQAIAATMVVGAVPAHAQAAEPADYSVMPAVDDLGQIIAPGDDGLQAEDAVDEPPPGYCNIWSADLLDPLDLLDELEESSALFDVPAVRLMLPEGHVAQSSPGRLSLPASAFFKPPILLS